MFAWWGRTVYRYRYIVIGVMVALCLGGGVFGISLGPARHPERFLRRRQPVRARLASLADKAYGRDTSGHIIGIYTAPGGQDRRRPGLQEEDPRQPRRRSRRTTPTRSCGRSATSRAPTLLKNMADADKQHAFMSIQLKGDNDDAILNNYKNGRATTCSRSTTTASTSSWPACSRWPAELTGTIGDDQKRRRGARPSRWCAWCCSSCSAASSRPPCPAIIGGLTIAGALGIMRLGRRIRAGALLRPAGGDADGARHRGRLRPVHGQPVP